MCNVSLCPVTGCATGHPGQSSHRSTCPRLSMSIRPPRASGTQLNTPQEVEMWLLMVFVCCCQGSGGAGPAGHHGGPESPVLQSGAGLQPALCGADRGQDSAGDETGSGRPSQRRGSIYLAWELLDSCGCVSLCADFGADWGPGGKHCVSGTGHSPQRGSAEGRSVQTLPPLPQTKHGALQRSSAAQV